MRIPLRHRDAERLFAGPVERVKRRTPLRRNGPIRELEREFFGGNLAAELRELERLADRLTVSHTDPERFHIDKSELKTRLGALAAQIEAR